MGVGPKIGYVDPEAGIKSTIAFGGVVDLGTITPQITLEGEVLYWSKSYDAGYWEWSYSQIYISGIAKYYFNQKKGAKFLPYAGGGLGLVIGKSSSDYKGEFDWMEDGSTDVSNTGLCLTFVGGAKYPLNKKTYGFGEFRYSTGGDAADILGVFVGVVFSIK